MNALAASWRVALAAWRRFDAHDGAAMAGYIAFSTFLSLFPFAIFFSALAGILIGPEDTQRIFDTLIELAPEHIAKTLLPVLEEVIGQSRGGVLTFAGLGAIWAASNAVESIRIGFDRAYDAEETRGFLRRRATAIAFLFFAAFVFGVLGVLIIAAPLAMRLTHDLLGVSLPFGLDLLRYALGLSAFALFLLVLNRVLPSRAPRIRQLAPGIAVTTLLWILGASAFSIYLAFAPSYSLTYGAFAGVIVTLLFFYLTGAVLIYGAEVNGALLARKASRTAITFGRMTEEV